MKRSIRMMLVALSSIVLCSATACADNDKPIDVSNLPAKAQTTLTTHFNKQKVVLATIEAGIVNKSYDVVLQNGTKLEFDKKGNLTEVDCKQGTVPAGLIPQPIQSYLQATYPGQSVKKIEIDRNERRRSDGAEQAQTEGAWVRGAGRIAWPHEGRHV